VAQSRILIVDDSAVILSSLQEMFGREFTIFTAPGAKEALSILASTAIDVIVTDFQMPGMDGLALLIEVKKRHPAVIRVLMTAYADMQLVIRAMNEGEIHRFISKPYKSFEFRRILEECQAMARIVEHRATEPQGRTVLVAHESAVSQAALRLLLTPAYQVLATANGIEALNLLATRRIDAVVLGVGLEQLDGCSIADYLKKEKRSTVPLVFWANGVAGPYEEYLRECGADLVLDQHSQDSLTQLQLFLKKRFS
jgi:CheY-like chemotaxis protein